jgi:hypothetical protein
MGGPDGGEERQRVENTVGGPGQVLQRAAPYRAFLLRCWREPGAGRDGGPAWRFAVMEVGGEQTQRGFACLKALVDYLEEDVVGGSRSPHRRRSRRRGALRVKAA